MPELAPFPYPLTDEIARNVDLALREDIGDGDLTAGLLPAGQKRRASVIAREAGVLCGTAWFERCFKQLDPASHIEWLAADGERISANQLLCHIEGEARALLSAERSALNFLQLLSGVASKARLFADLLAGTGVTVVDTRKTLPGLRMAQKYAVHTGGGGNHRFALWDAILIKENHIMAAGSIRQALDAARTVAAASAGRCRFIQIEVENCAELLEALTAGASMILLDNFSLDQLREAARINAGHAVLEASGNVSLETLRPIAETGVQRISVGALTKDVKAMDLSMRLQETTSANKPSVWEIDPACWKKALEESTAREEQEAAEIAASRAARNNQYFTVNDRPVKFVIMPDGGMDVLALNMRSGEFERDMGYLTRCVCHEGDVDELDEAAFLERVEAIRKDLSAAP
ncbi:MAG: nicotinate-nucleotide pyrophosphorylase (carboxylating) [Proteobacteria bacterium]|nr:nicotinate-nucleotide pyrophosphorylase (carboxylating) [Pseudomonadota bacterium]